MSKPNLPDQAARTTIRTRLDVNLLVEAGAGSGKTESLAGRMVETVGAGLCSIEEIAAVTFTKKAASELRGRFRQELERQLADAKGERRARLNRAIRDMERMFAGTIHSFCARLLRERPVEAGLAPGFREIEPAEDSILRRRAWLEYIDRQQIEGSPAFLALASAEVKPSDLEPAFRRICEHPDVEFPPGGAAAPDPGPAWAALDRFWADLCALCPPVPKETTCKVQLAMGPFRPRHRNASRHRPAVLVQLLAHWESEKKVTKKWWNGAADDATKLLTGFQDQTVRPFLKAWREYVYAHAMTLLAEARGWAAAQRCRAALLNFTDLLLFASRLLRRNAAVRESLQRKYRRIFIDEFQDTDPMQAELLFLLAAKPGATSDWTQADLRPGALFVVGDPKQSIYRFRRADIEVYQQARRRIEGSGGLVVTLTTCFRSEASICAFANAAFSGLFPKSASAQQPRFEHLEPVNSRPNQGCGVARLSLAVELQKNVPEADARAIASFIRGEVDAGRRTWADFLILTRKKMGRLGPYTTALEQARVPYEVSGSGGLLESEFVQALTTLLFSLTHPEDGVALTAVLRGPCFGVSDVELYDYRSSGGALNANIPLVAGRQGLVAGAIRQLQAWRVLVRRLPIGAAMDCVLEASGLLAKAAATSAGGGEAGKLIFTVDLLRAACEAGMTPGDAVAAIEQGVEDDESDAPVLENGRHDVVRIMNLHKAKGLEGKVVFLADPLAGVEPRADIRIVRSGDQAFGYLPITQRRGDFKTGIIGLPPDWARYEAEEKAFTAAEELRLLYVAATRARDLLVVSQWQGKPRSVTPPWQLLAPYLTDKPAIAIPAWPEEIIASLPDLSIEARLRADADRRAREAAMKPAAFTTLALSTLAQHSCHAGADLVEGPAGRDWGTLIHALLEYAVEHLHCTSADLDAVARWHTARAGGLQEYIPEAVAAMQRIRESAFWDRVQSADDRLVEVPLAALWGDTPGPPVIGRGYIDLALKLGEGWHIIDYKTDFLSVDQLVSAYGEQVRAYSSIWQRAVGQPVAFAGLFSIRHQQLSQDVRTMAAVAVGRGIL